MVGVDDLSEWWAQYVVPAVQQPLQTYPRDATAWCARLVLDVQVLRLLVRYLNDRADFLYEQLGSQQAEPEQARVQALRQVGLVAALSKLGNRFEVTRAEYERWMAQGRMVEMEQHGGDTLVFKLTGPLRRPGRKRGNGRKRNAAV